MEHKFVVTVECGKDWETPRVNVEPMVDGNSGGKVEIGDEVLVNGVLGIVMRKRKGVVSGIIPEDAHLKLFECLERNVKKTGRHIFIDAFMGEE